MISMARRLAGFCRAARVAGTFLRACGWPGPLTCPTVAEIKLDRAVGLMRLRGQSDDQVDVRLSVDELVLLKNLLHEVCNGMHFTENDLQTIFDVNRAEIEGFLLRTRSVLDRLQLNSE
jgi:hypothetical protein